MANQLSGQTGPSPRTYRAHDRHGRYARIRNADQIRAWLALIAVRLLTTANNANEATIYAKLQKYGYARVNGATNISQLP